MTPSSWLIVSAVLLLSTLAVSQYLPYTAAPVLLYTFDNQPNGLGPPVFNTTTITTTTHFSWTQRLSANNINVNGNNNHFGIAQFNGVLDMINMNTFPDNNNRVFNFVYGGGGIAIEYWVWFSSLSASERLADISNGYYQQNIWNFVQSTNDLAWRVFGAGVEYSYDIPAASLAVTAGQWRHIICQVIPLGPGSTQGNMTCYVNGVQAQTSSGTYIRATLPDASLRSQCFFGQIALAPASGTQPAVTPHFNGNLDLLAFYNNSLPIEAIQAHSLLIRPPIFEVYFPNDPHQIAGVTGSSYSWINVDTSDSLSAQSYHQGLLSLNGGSTAYIDLTTSSGAQSIGTTISTFGGPGSGVIAQGYFDGILTGFTLELIVKINSGAGASRIFSAGNGVNNNEIYVAWDPSNGGHLTLTVNPSTSPSITVTGINTATWYHVVFTITTSQQRANQGYGDCTAWINGVNASFASGCAYPPSIARSQAFIGTSGATGASTFNGLVDLVRVYDYALSQTNVGQLFNLTVVGLPPVVPFTYSVPLTSPGPFLSYTFDSPLPPNFDIAGYEGTNFSWIATDAGHSGVATFSGAFESSTLPGFEQYVDMNFYPDTYNRTMPIIGGSFSAEMWVKFTAIPTSSTGINGYARLFDIGGPGSAGSDNIFLTQYATSPNLYMSTYNHTTQSSVQSQANTITVGSWQHFVFVVSAGPLYTRTSSFYLYVNGVNVPNAVTTPTFFAPLYVQRPIAYMGKSGSPGNSLFQGYIDHMSFYNFDLQPEQIRLHYILPKLPIIDYAFATNLYNVNPVAAYAWAPFDTNDTASVQGQRSGLLVLNATNTNPTSLVYVNLNAASGPNSLYTTFPVIGGIPVGNGLTGTQYGWTIEVIFKDQQYGGFGQSTSGARVFDFASQTSLSDSITLGYGYGNNNRVLYFSVGNSQSTVTTIPVISPVTFGAWYQILIVMSPSTTTGTPTTGTITVYVDGVQLGSAQTGAAYPAPIVRGNAYFGRSNNGGQTWTGVIDAFRVYDYAMTQTQISSVAALLSLTSPPIFVPPSSSAGADGGGGGGSSGLSSGAIAGIVIAAVVVALCCLLLLVFFMCYYSPSKKSPAASTDGNAEVAASNTANPYTEQSDVQTHNSTTQPDVEMQQTHEEETV